MNITTVMNYRIYGSFFYFVCLKLSFSSPILLQYPKRYLKLFCKEKSDCNDHQSQNIVIIFCHPAHFNERENETLKFQLDYVSFVPGHYYFIETNKILPVISIQASDYGLSLLIHSLHIKMLRS